MNTIFPHRVTGTIATCVLAAFVSTSAAQDATELKPLRLSDLARAQDSVAQPTAVSDPVVSPTTAETTTNTTAASASGASDAVESTSRWSALPLPGAQKDSAPTSEMGKGNGSGAQDVLQVGGGLAGVLLLIWVLRTLIRKSSGSGAARGLSPGFVHPRVSPPSWLGIRWPGASMSFCSKWGDASWSSIRPPVR